MRVLTPRTRMWMLVRAMAMVLTPEDMTTTTTAVWPIMKMDVDVGEHEQGAEDEHEQEAAVELAVTS